MWDYFRSAHADPLVPEGDVLDLDAVSCHVGLAPTIPTPDGDILGNHGKNRFRETGFGSRTRCIHKIIILENHG
jgi:hypothetical protein